MKNGMIIAGLKPKEIKVLSFLFDNRDVFAKHIEHKLDLRQPEVSTILSDMTKKGWVAYKNIMGEGKGRPQHQYTLKKSKKEIISQIIGSLREKQKEIGEAIIELENV